MYHVTKNLNKTGERRVSIYIVKKPVKNWQSFKQCTSEMGFSILFFFAEFRGSCLATSNNGPVEKKFVQSEDNFECFVLERQKSVSSASVVLYVTSYLAWFCYKITTGLKNIQEFLFILGGGEDGWWMLYSLMNRASPPPPPNKRNSSEIWWLFITYSLDLSLKPWSSNTLANAVQTIFDSCQKSFVRRS